MLLRYHVLVEEIVITEATEDNEIDTEAEAVAARIKPEFIK